MRRGRLRRPIVVLALLAAATTAAAACATARRPVSPPPNVLLITADSLRPDRLDLSSSGRHPALAGLAARGTRFPNAFTVTPWTAPALVSIFTGLYPPTHGVVNRDDTTPPALATLPRLLAARGYGLGNFGFFTGVSYYRNLGLPPQAVEGAEVIGASLLAGWLSRAPEPFFAWIHLVEPHLPYGASGYEAAQARVRGSSGLERAQVSATVPLGGGLSFEEGDREKLLALYDADVDRLDRAVAEVLGGLSTSGREGRTLVVFTADHGEELLEHGWVGHASTSGEAALHDEVLRIPLVLAGPGVPSGRVAASLAQNVDVTPTILALLGLDVPRAMQGVSLVPAFEGRRVRKLAFFETSPGGHLTPEARRGERLEGVFDGRRLHADRVGAERHAADPDAREPLGRTASSRPQGEIPELAAELDRFRRRQARARLAVVSSHGELKRPSTSEVERLAEVLDVREPEDGAELLFEASGGTIRLAWCGDGPPRTFWVEYEVGSGLLSARGAFPVDESHVSFGPFPVAFWNDLAGYSPFRYRVLDPSAGRRSPWRSFRVAAR